MLEEGNPTENIMWGAEGGGGEAEGGGAEEGCILR